MNNRLDSARISEGSAVLDAAGGPGVPSRKHDIFYNPVMKHQRDVFVAVVDSFKLFPDRSPLTVGLAMEASGVRAIRLSKECARKLEVYANDYDPQAVSSLRANIAANGVLGIEVTCKSSDNFFLSSRGYDIIDIDPFGGPGMFLDAAIKKLSRGGLLCVTATDTAALCGLYPATCRRHYWATPSHDMSMHEWAVRILVRYCQMIGISQEKALIPVLCYKKDHYVRLYLRCEKKMTSCDSLSSLHAPIWVNPRTHEISLRPMAEWVIAGPMYLGPLVDLSAIDEKKFRAHLSDGWCDHLFGAGDNQVGYYHIPTLCSVHKIHRQLSVAQVIARLQKKGYVAYASLDETESVKSSCDYEAFIAALKTG